jgi:hypothetical protein
VSDVSDPTSLTVPAAGWYADRNDANTLRWWDGSQWTEHTHSIAPEQNVAQPVSAAAFGFTAVEPNPVAQTAVPVVPTAIAPGWYPDHTDRTIQRWWDGTQWTAHTAPSAAGVVSASAPAVSSSPVASANNTMATLALILALVSFAGLIFAPLLLLAISAIIIGIVALTRVPRFARKEGRRGQAIAGIVVGAVSLVTSVLLVVAALLVYQQVHHDVGTQSAARQSGHWSASPS